MSRKLIPPIIVIGSHGGGTSAIAGVLQVLGIDMGITEHERNEDRRMWNLSQLAERISQRSDEGRPWGWKDPGLVNYLEGIMAALPSGSRFVVVQRKPELVAASLERHMPMYCTLPSSLVYARLQQALIKEFIKSHHGVFVIEDFDQFRRFPRPILELLVEWLPGKRVDLDVAESYTQQNTYTDLRTYI